ncbi:UNKNOWN [Stylonychia lemnae]|uniref:Uncharacterized protein n=1 Tax=Stylonychia lemnae TaxID=5949 RepID=A0A077ZVF2_STYLE|nr:UNKNOWN [Stylonychia lemnae]|eukprot:CDW73270.1 UNKNOWN [Stylonychia lemnae]
MISEDLRHHHKGDIEKVGEKSNIQKPPNNPVDEPKVQGSRQDDYVMTGKDKNKTNITDKQAPVDNRDMDTKANTAYQCISIIINNFILVPQPGEGDSIGMIFE